jgi:hypothetical protein
MQTAIFPLHQLAYEKYTVELLLFGVALHLLLVAVAQNLQIKSLILTIETMDVVNMKTNIMIGHNYHV